MKCNCKVSSFLKVLAVMVINRKQITTRKKFNPEKSRFQIAKEFARGEY